MIVYQESENELPNNKYNKYNKYNAIQRYQEYLERLQYQRYQNGGYTFSRDFYVMNFVSLIVLILLAG